MDRQWIKKWKEYSDYTTIKRKMKYSYYYTNNTTISKYEIKKESFPGPISNSRILVPLDSFVNNGEKNDESNKIIRTDLEQRRDIRIVNKKIWEFFFQKYGGGPIIERGWINEGNQYSSRKIVEVYHRKIEFVCLKKRQILNKDTIYSLTNQTIYVSRTKNLSELKQIISDNLNSYNKLKFNEETNMIPLNIRLWKIESNSSLESFKDFLIHHLDEINNTDSQLVVDNILQYLEYIQKIQLKDLYFADTDLCVIEYIDDSSPPIFEIKKK